MPHHERCQARGTATQMFESGPAITLPPLRPAHKTGDECHIPRPTAKPLAEKHEQRRGSAISPRSADAHPAKERRRVSVRPAAPPQRHLLAPQSAASPSAPRGCWFHPQRLATHLASSPTAYWPISYAARARNCSFPPEDAAIFAAVSADSQAARGEHNKTDEARRMALIACVRGSHRRARDCGWEFRG